MDEKLKKLKDLMTIVQEGLTKTEFIKSFKAVVDLVLKTEANLIKKIDEKLDKAINSLTETYKAMVEKVEETKLDTLESIKDEAVKSQKQIKEFLVQTLKYHRGEMEAIEKKVSQLKDGRDGKDGKDGRDADETKILQTLETKMEAMLKEKINIMQELFDGQNKAMDKKLGAMQKSRMLAARQLRMSDFSFTGDGSTTAFTLPKEPGAKGKAIWVFLNGQYLQLGVHYTIAKRTMNTTFTPENGAILEGYLINF